MDSFSSNSATGDFLHRVVRDRRKGKDPCRGVRSMRATSVERDVQTCLKGG
jgi:hypothetical protein